MPVATSPQVAENYTAAYNRNLIDLSRYIFQDSPREYDQVARVQSTDRLTNEMQAVQGLSKPRLARDLEPIPQTAPQLGYKTTIRIQNFKVGVTVEETLMRTAVFKGPIDNARDMMRSTVTLKDQTTVDFYNNGFTSGLSTNIVEADGTAREWFSTGHYYENGASTWSNFYNVGVPPNPDTVFLIINNYLRRLKDFTGTNFVNYGNRFIIVTPTLTPSFGMAAREIIQSVDRPDTANRATNVLKNFQLDSVELNNLTSTSKWFIIIPPNDASFPLAMLEMIPYEVSPLASLGAVNPDAYQSRCRTQFGCGFDRQYRGACGIGS